MVFLSGRAMQTQAGWNASLMEIGSFTVEDMDAWGAAVVTRTVAVCCEVNYSIADRNAVNK